MKKSILLLFMGFFLFQQVLLGQAPGKNDPTFNPDDVGYGSGMGFDDTVWEMLTLPDGRVLVAGDFTTYNGFSSIGLIMLNPDGTPDATFIGGTGFDGPVYALARQADGKILVGGSFTEYNGTTRNGIARLNENGTLDVTFTVGAGIEFGDYIDNIDFQSDGKIIITGAFTSYRGQAKNNIVRVNANGTVDNTFISGSGFDDIVNFMKVTNGDKIVCGGAFTTYDGEDAFYFTQLNADGSKDTTFNTGEGFDDEVFALDIQPDGKIIAVGFFASYQGTEKGGIVRINTDGSIDEDFKMQFGFDFITTTVKVLNDGKIMVGGGFSAYDDVQINTICRLNSDGTIDEAFNPQNGFNNFPFYIAENGPDKVIVGGSFIVYFDFNPAYRIISVNSDGSIDENFNPQSGFENVVENLALTPEDGIVAVGSFNFFNKQLSPNIAKLTKDGAADPNFDAGFGFDGSLFYTAVQKDGKILTVGDYSTYNDFSANKIARLNPDGSFDEEFSQDIAFGDDLSETVYCVGIQQDQKILAGGFFSSYNNIPAVGIVRINQDGTTDLSFQSGSGVEGDVYVIKPLADGKILIGGSFTAYNGTALSNIARLNADGSLDNSFVSPGTINGYINTIGVQTDGKIIIGGGFTAIGATARNRMARLNTNGSLDATFTIGSGFNGVVYNLVVQPDDKILASGFFTTFNGSSRRRIAKLNANGTLNTAFDPGVAYNGNTNTLALQKDGKVVVAGFFTVFDGIGRNCINRLYNDLCDVKAEVAITNPTCSDIANGALKVSVSSGIAPYTFTLGTGIPQSDSLFNGLPAGNFTLTVTDNFACPLELPVLLDAPDALSIITGGKNFLCNGAADGDISIVATGGTAPYSFSINGGAAQPSPFFAGLSAGDYQITITDSNACVFTDTVVIAQADSIIASLQTENVTCYGGNNGSVSVEVSGGVAPYSYNLSGTIQDNPVFGTLVADNYALTITDSIGCSISVITAISQPDSLIASILNVTDASCPAATDAAATLEVIGGVLPYNYTLNGQTQSTPLFEGLSSGTYTVQVSDSNACTTSIEIFAGADSLPVIPVITQSGDTLFSSYATGNQWYLNDTLLEGATESILVVSQEGNYTVSYSTTEECSVISAPLEYIVSGIKNNISDVIISIAPNPNKGQFIIRATLLQNRNYVVQVRNTLGQTISEERWNVNGNTIQMNMDLSKYGSGMYLISITDGSTIATKQVIVQ